MNYYSIILSILVNVSRTYFGFCWFCVVSCFSSPPQQEMTSNFKRIPISDLIHYYFCLILILPKEPVFPFLMLSAKQGNYWYYFYIVFVMTRSLTGDCTWDVLHSKPALYHQAIEERVFQELNEQ